MANKVEIDIITNTEKAKASMNGLKGSWTEFNSMLSGAKQAAQMVGQAYQVLVGDTMKYAATVRQLSRVTGQSTEDTSRMIQMTDDLAIELGTLEQAAKGAAMKGIAFNTESLAKLADQYVALQDPVSKNTFLLQTFGRAGLEMAKAMEVGGDKIREMSGAIEDNLVLSAAQVKAARDLEIGLDNLNDTWAGLKTELGNQVIPVLVSATGALNDMLTMSEVITSAYDEHRKAIIVTSLTYADYQKELLRSAQVVGGLQKYHVTEQELLKLDAQGMDKLTFYIGGMTEATWNATRAFDPLIDKFTRLQTEALPGLSSTIYSDTAQNYLKEMLDNGTLSAQGYEKALKKLQDFINGMTGKTIDVTVNERWLIGTGPGPGGGGNQGESTNPNDHIEGSPVEGHRDMLWTFAGGYWHWRSNPNYVAPEEHQNGDDAGGNMMWWKAGGKWIKIPKKASGGAAEGLTWVGERGPELVNLPPKSYVHSNEESKKMAAGTQNIYLIVDGKVLATALAGALR